MTASSMDPGLDCDFGFFGLSASVAGTAEMGYSVISSVRSFRMHADVPRLIPEVNPDHTALIGNQLWTRGGYIVTNPNCSTVGLICALRPLQDVFGRMYSV